MFKWLNKLAYNSGIQQGRALIDGSMLSTINELNRQIKKLQSEKKELEKELNETVLNAGKEMIKISQEAGQAFNDLRTEWIRQIERSTKSREVFEKKLNQLEASELYINNYLQSRAQESISAGAKFKSDIQDIKIATEKEIKKIEK